jgi:hypothetical protein
MEQEEQYLDSALSEQDKYYLYITLPISVGEDSVTVENFLADVWKKPLTPETLKAFSNAFEAWVMARDAAREGIEHGDSR